MTEAAQFPTASGALAPAPPPAALALLAPPPLIEGEDAAAYDDLLARISGTLKPKDILEEIWVRDVVDLVWDAFRLRRLKAQLLTAAAHEGMAAILGPFLDWNFSDRIARQWALREEAAVAKADAVLAAAGLTTDAVTARTLALRIDDVERIDRMTMAAEARRNAVLREIERHRAAFARTLRRAVEDVEEAEFTVIAPGAPAQEGAT